MPSIQSFEKPSIANIAKLLVSKQLTNYEKQALKSYRAKIDNKTGYVKVSYEIGDKEFGRYKQHATKGKTRTTFTATLMRKEIRNAIFRDTYDDLDISNASGAVLLQIFKNHKLPVEHLEMYATHREEILEMIMKHLNVNRCTAKKIMIEIFFCGSGKKSMYDELNPLEEYSLPPVVKKLKAEFHANLEKLIEMKEYEDIRKFCEETKEEKGEKSWIGTFSAILYQDEERKILTELCAEINRIGKTRKIENPVGSLIFDGLHVDKRMMVGDMVEKLESHLHSKTGYRLKLEIKEMELSKEEEEDYLLTNPVLTYEEKREIFERTHFKTTSGKKLFHKLNDWKTIDENDLESYDKSIYTTIHEDMFEDASAFLDEWYVDPAKRKFDEIEYSCVKDCNKKPNIYYAFPTLRFTHLESCSTPEQKAENVKIFRQYIKEIVEDNEDYVDWMEHWLADILQNPDTKGATPISVILYSKQGTGKSSLTQLMKKLLGTRCVYETETPTHNGDVFHEFNSVIKYKLFVEIREVNMKATSTIGDQVKGFITANEHNIVHKGFDPITVKATERILWTTNQIMSMFIEKGDRRMAAFKVSEERLSDPKANYEHWVNMYARFDDNNFIKDVAEYLMSINTIGYNLRDNRPLTDYYNSLIQFSLPVELDFLREKLLYNNTEYDEYLILDEKKQPTNTCRIGSQKLFDLYNDWRKNSHKSKEEISGKAFAMKMKQFENYGVYHKHDSTSNVFHINKTTLTNELYKDFNISVEPVKHKPLSQPQPQPVIKESKQIDEECGVKPEIHETKPIEIKIEEPTEPTPTVQVKGPSATSRVFIIPKMPKMGIHDETFKVK